ncbi:hypothetical protein D9758_017355 [Tetrapyrgos nigripes]|uniref:Uncharacterized protein n=1 Tax=Tetrapyrgos nigripes TaxID=182062 RepID=A0A8H5C5W9_9AGAR|nr:hypothetical protein D9758_017355 [Tetrapyrgos nigripes]
MSSSTQITVQESLAIVTTTIIATAVIKTALIVKELKDVLTDLRGPVIVEPSSLAPSCMMQLGRSVFQSLALMFWVSFIIGFLIALVEYALGYQITQRRALVRGQ